MYALVVNGTDPTGKAAKVVQEVFATDPNFNSGLDVRNTGTTVVTVGMLANADGTYSNYLAPPLTKFDLKNYAAAARYNKETGGITVNGAAVATDRESQAMVNGAYAYALINPQLTISFKTEAGFTVLNATQITAVATAIAAHVQACFAVEASLDSGIDAGTVVTTAAIDTALASVA